MNDLALKMQGRLWAPTHPLIIYCMRHDAFEVTGALCNKDHDHEPACESRECKEAQ